MNVKSFRRRFGLLVRLNRLKTDLKQSELGLIIGANRVTITNIELGVQSPSLLSFLRLCKLFEVDPMDFCPDLICTIGEIRSL